MGNKRIRRMVLASALICSLSVTPVNAEPSAEVQDLQNEQADLANGSRVKLTVVRDQALGAMTVPLSAVNYDGGIPYVYCLENGIAVRTDVEVGIHDEERIEILGGLEDGSQVIYSWSNELVDGAEVLLKGASEATEESGQEAGEDA